MLRNDLAAALRNLVRNKFFAALNVPALAVGTTLCRSFFLLFVLLTAAGCQSGSPPPVFPGGPIAEYTARLETSNQNGIESDGRTDAAAGKARDQEATGSNGPAASKGSSAKRPTSPKLDEILVVGQANLSGLWRIPITQPTAKLFKPSEGLTYAPARDAYCRLEQTKRKVAGGCFMGKEFFEWSGEVDKNNFHLTEANLIGGKALYAQMLSRSTFKGTYALQLAGIRYGASEEVVAAKISLTENPADAGGKAADVTRILKAFGRDGVFRDQNGVAIDKGNRWHELKPAARDEWLALGSVERTMYLGGQEVLYRRYADAQGLSIYEEEENLKFYVVEFTNGLRLCGIHERDDGVLDGLGCF